MNTARAYATCDGDVRETLRARRAERADRNADERDTDADHAADAAEERDRQAALRDRAAARRQIDLLVDALRQKRDDGVGGAACREESAAVREQAEIDHETRRSILVDAATLDVGELLRILDLYIARWQAVRRELTLMASDRTTAAEDRHRAARERNAARRARVAGAADRASGAADRDQRQIEQAQLPHGTADWRPGS